MPGSVLLKADIFENYDNHLKKKKKLLQEIVNLRCYFIEADFEKTLFLRIKCYFVII